MGLSITEITTSASAISRFRPIQRDCYTHDEVNLTSLPLEKGTNNRDSEIALRQPLNHQNSSETQNSTTWSRKKVMSTTTKGQGHHYVFKTYFSFLFTMAYYLYLANKSKVILRPPVLKISPWWCFGSVFALLNIWMTNSLLIPLKERSTLQWSHDLLILASFFPSQLLFCTLFHIL